MHFPETPTGHPGVEIRISRGKRHLVATEDQITVDGQVFRLADVDQVAYRAAARINQASYRIGVAQGGAKATFTFDAYRRGTEMEDSRVQWGNVVDLLEARVCPRIAAEAVAAVSAGGKWSFGSLPATRVEADVNGLRVCQPFGARIPWDRVYSADMHQGCVRVWDAKSGGTRPRISIDMSGWNAVVLPRVIAMVTARG